MGMADNYTGTLKSLLADGRVVILSNDSNPTDEA
jgi:hypothetical protein